MESGILKPRLHILARAVIRRGNTILLTKAKGYANTFLPGGHLEHGESLKTSLARELLEELGLKAQVHTYLGAVEHEWGNSGKMHYELNHLFEALLPTLAEGKTPASREAHLTFLWAELSKLTEHGLEPYPLRHLLNLSVNSRIIWASTLPERTP